MSLRWSRIFDKVIQFRVFSSLLNIEIRSHSLTTISTEPFCCLYTSCYLSSSMFMLTVISDWILCKIENCEELLFYWLWFKHIPIIELITFNFSKLNEPFTRINKTIKVSIIFTFSIRTFLILLIERLIDSGWPKYRKINNFAEPNSRYFQFDCSKISV